MQKPGRDAREERSIIYIALARIFIFLADAFFLFVIKPLESTVSALRRKRAMFALALLLVPLSALTVLSSALLIPLSNSTASASSNTLNFQGRLLTNTGGLVPDGTYNMEFNLYNVDTGGSTLWTEDRLNTNTQGVTVRNGYFSVYLGEYDSFGALNWNQDLYLGMTIRGTGSCAWGACMPADSEMSPRFALSSVPYAIRARQLAQTAGSFTSTLSFDTPTQNNTITIPDDSGEVCLDSGNCAGVGGTGDILDGGQAGAISIGTTDNTTLTLLQNNAAALTVNASQLLQFNAYNCATFANGGTLTTDASGNVVCADDDGGGGGGGVTTLNTLSGALSVQGTANEIEITDNSTTTITVGLPDDVTIGDSLTVTNGLTVTAGGATISAGGIAVTGNSTIAGTLTGLTGITSSGTIRLSALTTDGFVKTTGTNGTLAVSSTVALGSEVSGTLAVSNGGTGATDAAGARTNLGLVIGTNVQAYNANTSLLGSSIEGSEITDNTIEEPDLEVTNAATDNYILSYDSVTGGFTWIPDNSGTDSQNLFATFNTSAGTDPVADSPTDTLNVTGNTGVVVTGDSSTDTITITSTLGTSVDLTSEITGTLAVGNGGTGSTTAAGARTNLGATTVGGNLFTLTNPSAVTFLRVNADNTVSALDATSFRAAIGAGTSSTTGTVTSVGVSGGTTGLSTSGGPITTSGTITLSGTLAVSNGGTGAIDAAGARTNLGLVIGTDIQSYNANTTTLGNTIELNTETTGTLSVANGGTGATDAATARTNLGLGTIAVLNSIDISANTNLAVGNGITLTGDTLTVTAAGGLAQTTGGLTTTGVLEDLNTLGAATAADQFIVSTAAGVFAYESGATVRTSLGLGSLATLSSVDNSNWSGTDLSVANGGTGVSTFTANGILYGNGASAVGVTAAGTTGQCLLGNTAAAPSWGTCTGDGGVTTLAAIGAVPNANGATISGTTLNLQPANASFGGVVTTGAQTFAGAKTFNDTVIVANATNGISLRAGNNSVTTTANQLTLSYAGTANYSQAIKTRHHGSQDAGNAIDFYVWDFGTDAAGTVGTNQVFTIDSGNLGSVGVNTGTAALAANLVVNNQTSTADIVQIQDNGSSVFTIADGGVSTFAGVLNANAGATLRGLTVNNATATDDQIATSIAAGGAARFTGTITNADFTANHSFTLPNATGTFCLTSGNCAGIGGTGDILNNGQAGAITIGTNDATALNLETTNIVRLTVTSGGDVNIANNLQTGGTTRLTNAGVLQNVTNADASTFFTGGQLPVADGGTGAATFTANGILYGNGTSAIGATAAGTTGQCLTGNTSAAPSWASCGSFVGLTLDASSGTPETLANGDTITIAAGSNLTSTVGTTDTVTLTVVANPTFSGLVTAAGDLTVTSGTSGDSILHLEADTDNNAEGDNPYILLEQDAALVRAILGQVGGVNLSPDGTAYTGTTDNATLFGTISNNSNLQLGAGGVVALTLNSSTQAATFSGDLNVSGTTTLNATSITGASALSFGGDVSLSRTAANVLSFAAGDSLVVSNTGGYYLGSTSSPLSLELTRAVPVVVGDYIEIGNFNISAGAHNIRVSLTTSASSFSVAKTFLLPVYYNATANTWRTVLPTSDSGPYGANDYDLEINVNLAVASLRIRRTGGAAVGNAMVRIESVGSTSDVFTASSATGTAAAPSATYSPLYQNLTNGRVGVGTSSPSYSLDVNGTFRSASTSNAIFGNGTTGGLQIGDGTVTKTSGSGFNFSSIVNATQGFRYNNTATAGNYLRADGTAFIASSLLAGDITGTLGIANGGTGQTTAQSAINALSGLTTNGDLLYHNGTNSTRLARGSTNQCLTSNATTIVWGSCSAGGGVTGSGTSGQVTYFNGAGTVTSSANLLFNGTTLTSNTLAVTNNATVGGTLTATGNISTSGALIEKSVTFTPTTVGWYRIASTSTTQGGTVRMRGIYDNKITDVEFQYNIGGYGVGGSIQQTRYSSYVSGFVSAARISSDGGANTYLDIYISSATTPAAFTIYGYGPNMPIFVASPVVGAVAGSTNVQELTLGHGFRSTSGSIFAQTAGNVGVGTATPNDKFTVKVGTDQNFGVLSSGSTTTLRSLNDANSSHTALQFYASQYIMQTGLLNLVSGSFQTNSTTRLTNAGVLQNVTYNGATIDVAYGGTGTTTFTQYGIMYGNGTSALQVTAAGTTGQCLLANTGAAPTWGSCGSGFANTSLSNLSSVAINTSLLPGANDTIDLGSNTLRWRDLYLGGETINIGTSSTDQGTIGYNTTSNILQFGTDATTNGDIAFFTDDLYIDKSAGTVGIGTASPNSATSRLHVTGTATDVPFGRTSYLYSALTSGTNTQGGTMFETEVGPSAATGQVFRGILNDIKANSANVASAQLQAARNAASVWGATNVGSLAGTVSKVSNDGSGTVTSGYALYAESATNNGVLTNNYGLFVQAQTAGTNDYGIYVENADTYALWVDNGVSRFDGDVGIGVVTPSYKLDVSGVLRIANANHQLRINDTDSGIDEWTISTVSSESIGFYENGTTQRLLLSASGDLTVPTGSLTVTGGSLTVSAGAITGNYALTPGCVNWNTYGVGGSSAGIYNDCNTAGPYEALMIVGNNSAGGSRIVKVWDVLAVQGALTANTLDTGLGANELYDMNQNVTTTSAVSFATLNTGLGANELYDMNQNVTTASNVTFNRVLSGSAAAASSPNFGFSGDTDSGMYMLSDGILGFTTNSGMRLRVRTDTVHSFLPFYVSSVIASSGAISIPAGSPAGAGPMCFSGGVANAHLGINTHAIGGCASLNKYKDNVTDLPYGLDLIRQLRPVQYKWNINDENWDTGFIAEEVEALNPIYSTYMDGKLLGVQYSHMTSLAIKGIQILDNQVQNLQVTVNNHESRLTILESKNTWTNLTVTNHLNANKLTVTGLTQLASLKVTGITEVADLKVNGKIITVGNTPTAVLGATSTGQGSSYTIEGNDTAGTITVTTGTAAPGYPLAAGQQVSVTFDEAFEAAPRIALTAKDINTAGMRHYVETTATGFTIHFLDAPTATTNYTFDYIVIQ